MPAACRGFISTMRRLRLLALAALWVGIVVLWFVHRSNTGEGTTAAVAALIDGLRDNWWSIPAFILLSVARPFVLVPATLLTVGAGLVYGPVLGLVVAAAGANASAMVGHTVGATVAPGWGSGLIASWGDRLRRNSFESVLIMRLIFLPYDLVNYGAGLLGVRRWPFLAATAIGSLPGTVSFVLLGASLTDLSTGVGGIDRPTLIASIALIVASLAASRLLRRSAPSTPVT